MKIDPCHVELCRPSPAKMFIISFTWTLQWISHILLYLKYDKVALFLIERTSLNPVENSILRKLLSEISGSFPEKNINLFCFCQSLINIKTLFEEK